MTPEEVKAILDAHAERMRHQARLEAQHETVRRSHRAVALAGGGEQECARRREQERALIAGWVLKGFSGREIRRLIAERRGIR